LAGTFFKKYASIDGVGFSIRRHAFKMAATTSFHATVLLSAGAYAAASDLEYIVSSKKAQLIILVGLTMGRL